LLNSNRKIFHQCSGHEQVQEKFGDTTGAVSSRKLKTDTQHSDQNNNGKKASNGWCWCIFNKDGLDNHRATGVASSDYHRKTYGEFDRERMLWLWCSTLLKRSITCSVAVVKHIIHYNPRSSFSNYSQVTPHREVIPSPPHGDVQFCGTRPGKRHQWPTTFILS
jgi:hypothetical protein